MKKITWCMALLSVLSAAGQHEGNRGFWDILQGSPNIAGKQEYLASPYVTAGDRVYMVGHQDGTFPELGWHIDKEMGGIWDHPVKLMDGFRVRLLRPGDTASLDKAKTFVNYPMANVHSFDLQGWNLLVERWQFVPDGLEAVGLEFDFRNTGSTPVEFLFELTGDSDLRPTWLGERTNMTDGKDQASYDDARGAWIIKDSANPWFVVFGSKAKPDGQEQHVNSGYRGNGVSGMLSYRISLAPGEVSRLRFTIAGSYRSKQEALETYELVRESFSDLLVQKKERYEKLALRSRLTLPDKKMEQAFEWLKYNCDWLLRTVPEIGTGIMAGIPDYPWWFGVDSEYALKGYMAIGQDRAVYETISLLDSISRAVNGNGRIVHEVSTNGAVFNPGNINETPQFASLIREIYRWNGDREFLARYFPTIRDGLGWLLRENDANNNLFPEGFGMMEIHGLDSEMIDVAAYTQRAFADASEIAGILGEKDLELEYAGLADSLKERINKEFWSDTFDSYADFIGTDEQALHLIEAAIVRADTLKKPWAVEELKNTRKTILENPSPGAKPFVVHHNWVVNTPMEMNLADPDKAIRALQTAERFVNPFGVFVTGIDRDESAGQDDGSFRGSKVFTYTGAVMTLPTGVQIISENNYGHREKALEYLQRMTRSFSFAFPGSMYEVSPDYGMMTQAWNIYGFAVPVVQQFFGLQPDAGNKTVTIRPGMPKAWNRASLENVRVGDNAISIFYDRTPTETRVRVVQEQAGWKMRLQLEKDENGLLEIIRGKQVTASGYYLLETSGKELEAVVHYRD